MTQNKRKTAAKGTPRRRTIRQRAQAIIADAKGYDADTRKSLKLALEHNDSDLAELVRRAEAGDIILDCTEAAHRDLVAQGEELSRFEHHLAEALRIGREHPMIPASLYNGLADAGNDFLNDLPRLARFNEDERVIALALETYMTQTQERAEKGGAKVMIKKKPPPRRPNVEMTYAEFKKAAAEIGGRTLADIITLRKTSDLSTDEIAEAALMRHEARRKAKK